MIDARLPRALPATPYARWGDWPFLAALIALLAGGLVRLRPRAR